jgi:hypothetical protein
LRPLNYIQSSKSSFIMPEVRQGQNAPRHGYWSNLMS